MPSFNLLPRRAARILLGCASLSSLLLTSCWLTGESGGCTIKEEDEVSLSRSNINHNELLSGTRYYSWDVHLTDLCVAAPESKNQVIFEVTANPLAPYDLRAQGFVQPAYGYEPYETGVGLPQYPNVWTGLIDNIGLRQGSLDGKHGYADITLTLSFTTTGTDQGDYQKLSDGVYPITISWKFQHLSPDNPGSQRIW